MTINFDAERQSKIAFAHQHGYTIQHDEKYNLWRVYKHRTNPFVVIASDQVAMCNIEWDAIDVSFALAMVDAGARL